MCCGLLLVSPLLVPLHSALLPAFEIRTSLPWNFVCLRVCTCVPARVCLCVCVRTLTGLGMLVCSMDGTVAYLDFSMDELGDPLNEEEKVRPTRLTSANVRLVLTPSKLTPPFSL